LRAGGQLFDRDWWFLRLGQREKADYRDKEKKDRAHNYQF
jgi:hypothetical protein